MTPYPEPFNVQHDITVPGKPDKFIRQLNNALRTRGLLRACTDRVLTYTEVAAANADADDADIMQLFDNITATRQQMMNAICSVLPSMVVGLTNVEMKEMDVLVMEYNGPAIYERIRQYSSHMTGRAQDIIQDKYMKTVVHENDSMAQIVKQIDQKWYLYQKHALLEAVSLEGQREAIRQIMKMLTKGPRMVATAATLTLMQAGTMALPDDGADGYLRDLMETYRRYDLSSAGNQQGSLYMAAGTQSQSAPYVHKCGMC